MEEIVSGRIRGVIDEHPMNAAAPILVSEVGKLISLYCE